MLELTSLQLVHALQLHLRHIVPVHVHQYILDHYDAELHLLPRLIDLFQQVLVTTPQKFLHNRLEQLDSGTFHSVIEKITVFV